MITLVTAGHAVVPATGKSVDVDRESYQPLKNVVRARIRDGSKRKERWEVLHKANLKDDRLLVYYDFEQDELPSGRLINRSKLGLKSDGAIIGADWEKGPWEGKQALAFRSPSDRVRIYIPGKHMEVTLACWVGVDVYKNNLSSLMLSDGTSAGDVHWQINGQRLIQLGVYFDKSEEGTYHTQKP